jgi:hypothetical protein
MAGLKFLLPVEQRAGPQSLTDCTAGPPQRDHLARRRLKGSSWLRIALSIEPRTKSPAPTSRQFATYATGRSSARTESSRVDDRPNSPNLVVRFAWMRCRALAFGSIHRTIDRRYLRRTVIC